VSNFAERRRQWLAKDPSVHWLHTRRLCEFGPCVCGVQLQSRQRPRKGVRLGGKKREAQAFWQQEWDWCDDEARDDYVSRVGADCRAHGLC